MVAQTSEEEQKRRRRNRLIKGLLIGGAAIGVPALANALIARRSARLRAPAWGRSHAYAWEGGEVTFQRLGKGEPLVLLHSFGPGHDSEEWRSSAEILAKKHRVFVPDLLGWGRSDKPPLSYDGELYIRLISDFLEDVVRKRAVVAAAGLSAAYAVQLAVDQPEAVRALALVVPSGIDIHGDEPDLRDAMIYRALRTPLLGTSALNLYTSQAAIGQYLRREIFASPDRVDASRIERYYRSSHQPGSHLALAAYVSGYLNHSVAQALGRLKVPVWIGWGRQARASAVERADVWLQLLPDASLEVFEGSGNLPHQEVADRFCLKLGRFLSKLPA